MPGPDTYLTINTISRGLYKEKGSSFISLAYPAASPEEVKIILERVRKEYNDARHHCYAYMLGQERKNWRSNDDGEPSGTGGKPILGQISSSGLTNILIIVVRYFGGRLLGTGGLINAYRSAAGSAIKNAEIIEMTVQDYYELTFPYSSMNSVMKIIKDEGLGQSDQKFDQICRMTISFRRSLKEQTETSLRRIEGLVFKFSHTS